MTITIPLELRVGSQRHRLQVRLPPVGEVVSLWMVQHLRTPMLAEILQPAEVRRFLTTPEGEPISRALALSIASDPGALAAYRAARDDALMQATEGGIVFAECPHCRGWEADLIPLALAVGLHTRFWPVSDTAGSLAVPAFANPCDRSLQGELTASRLTFALPRMPDTSPRGQFAKPPEAPARYEYWKAQSEAFFRDHPDDVEDWTPDSPGWIALLRFAAMMAAYPEPRSLASIPSLTKISLADFLFIDNIYYLLHCVPQPDDSPLRITCHNCGGMFQPLALSPHWDLPA